MNNKSKIGIKNKIKLFGIRLFGVMLLIFFILAGVLIGSLKENKTLFDVIAENKNKLALFIEKIEKLAPNETMTVETVKAAETEEPITDQEKQISGQTKNQKPSRGLIKTKTVMQPIINLEAKGIYLGAVLDNIPGKIENLFAFEEKIGKQVAIVHWFQDWSEKDKDFKIKIVESLWQHGTIVLISWEPWETTRNYARPQPQFEMAKIAQGDFDPYIREWAKAIKSFGGPVLIRFAHEMDGNWYPWAIGMNNTTEEEYINAWKHIHDVFKEEKVSNVQWVWSPNWNDEWPVSRYDKIYPGDEYVDWIGMSIFNWGTTVTYQKWDTLDKRLGWRYKLALKYNKPIILAELSCDETGGSKSRWILDGFASLKKNYPLVKAIVWFNYPQARYSSQVLWAVDSSPEALEAFRQAIRDPYFLGPQFEEVPIN